MTDELNPPVENSVPSADFLSFPSVEDDMRAEKELEEAGVARFTWFAVLSEPCDEYVTRVIRGDNKSDLRQKLRDIDANHVVLIIRGKEIPKTCRIDF